MMTVYVKNRNGTKFWRIDNAPQSFIRRYDNGAIVSCGLTCGEHGLGEEAVLNAGGVEVTHEEWNHSGCQSSCVLRGNATCHW